MSSATTLNSNNKTLLNTASNSEIDNLTGTTVLNKYMLLNKIGSQSGEAVLYIANHLGQNNPVVVKIYCRANAIKPEVLQKLAELDSPYIIKITDSGYYKSYPCVVMPYYRNGSLQGKTLDYDMIRDIVIPEVTAGLKYLHENGILHKDIKPANLMISDDGMHVNIIDFGISSARDENVSVLITKTGMSPEYSAPETFNNVWVEESDYYSFGITLYELFKGFTPFQNSFSKDELAASASIQKIPFSMDFPKELVTLIKGLTYKDLSNRNDENNPNRRWTSREIDRWLKGENLQIPGESGRNVTAGITENQYQSNNDNYVFSSPYDFKVSSGRIVNLHNLQELIEAFGTNWKEGKKHVGRGYLSQFFLEKKMRSASSIVKDCEDEGVSDLAYSKMLIELGEGIGCHDFFWNSVKIDDMKKLSDMLTESMFNESSSLEKEYSDIFLLISYWNEINNQTDVLNVLNNIKKLSDVGDYDTKTKVSVLCSFLNPNMQIKIGDSVYQNVAELAQFAESLKLEQIQRYFSWIEQNISDLERYAKCIDKTIAETADRLKQEWKQEQKRREENKFKEEQARKEREEQARKEREEQARKEREEQARKEREEKPKRNPVLNSPDDITEDLIDRIITNNLESLTINYEFATTSTSEVKLYSHLFSRCLKSQDLTNPFRIADKKRRLRRIDFEIILGKNVHSLAFAFSDMWLLEFVNLKDTSKITNMSYMFYEARAFDQPIDNWDVSNVTNMSGMFCKARAFNQPIGNWDVSNVTNMSYMFDGASAFNQPIGNWDVSSVSDIRSMFSGAISFNQPIGNWDVSKVKYMDHLFEYARSFNQPIGNWDVSKVRNMERLFAVAESFNQPIGDWNVSNVTYMNGMFQCASSFNQPIGNWDVSNVGNMVYMFYCASSFNQPLDNWNISHDTNMESMFWEANSYSYQFPKPRGII